MENPFLSRTVCRPSLLPHAQRSLSDDSEAESSRDEKRVTSSVQRPFLTILVRLPGYDSSRERLMLSFFYSGVQSVLPHETRKSEQQSLCSRKAPERRCLQGISFLCTDQYKKAFLDGQNLSKMSPAKSIA